MPDAIKIVHVFPSFAFGGQQVRFAALANGLGEQFSHHVVALDGNFEARRLIRDRIHAAYETINMRKSALASVSNIRRLKSVLTERGGKILCTYNWGSIEAVLANKTGSRLPHIHFEDGFGPGESAENQPRRRVLARRLLLRGATTIVPSRQLEKVATEIWRLPPDNVLRLTNGVDFDKFQLTPSPSGPEIRIGSVGALRPEKNYERMIRSFVAADINQKATLTIFGDGPERTKLKTVIAELQAGDRVSLPGATDKPETAYAKFDVFALSSDTEQAPISLIEAMASGLPVVATNVGDITEMVCEENLAFITPQNNDDSYIEALQQIIQNPDARAKIGAANRKKAREEFSLDTMVASYRQIYLGHVAA